MSEHSGLAYSPLAPPLAVAVYLACIAGAGALANCSVLASLLKASRNGKTFLLFPCFNKFLITTYLRLFLKNIYFSISGLCSIIIQIAVADFLIIGTSALPELWYYNSRTWKFGYGACVAYRGLNVFASAASSYLIATITLHTIATVNVEEKSAERRLKRRDTEDEDLGSSHHSLVANSDSSTPRTMNVDYRLMDTRVPVTPPSVFVWILSASLSVPEFALATTVHLNENVVLCTAVDAHHKLNMHSLLAAFNLFMPTIIMSIAATLVIIKLKSKNLPDLDICDSTAALKLSLWMILEYGVLCAPRSIFAVYHVYSRSYTENEVSSFEMEQLDDTTATARLALSGVYLSATLIRPLLYLIMLPKIRNMFSFGSRIMDKV